MVKVGRFSGAAAPEFGIVIVPVKTKLVFGNADATFREAASVKVP